jgi:four helix bundle protein
VGVRDFRDFVAWQLSYQLTCEVFAFTAIGPAARDFKYRDQIRDSSASAHRNIAEGYGLYDPGQFGRFCGYALGSLEETKSSLIDGRDRAYLDENLYSRLWNLARAAERATRNLKFYLDSKDARKNHGASASKNPKDRGKKEP